MIDIIIDIFCIAYFLVVWVIPCMYGLLLFTNFIWIPIFDFLERKGILSETARLFVLLFIYFIASIALFNVLVL